MQRIFLKSFTVVLLTGLTAYGQSLADIARQYKEKQDAEQTSGVKPKVITNLDLGEGPDGRPDLRVEQQQRHFDRQTTTASAAGSPDSERQSGEMNQRPENPFGQRQGLGQGLGQGQRQGLGQQGLGQRPQQMPGQQPWSGQRPGLQGPDAQGGEQWRQRVLEQESRVQSMQARIDQMNAATRSSGASAQGPYNRNQARQMERVAAMQQQLDEQKRRLELMQDAARRQGMHTQVYDP